MDAWLPVSHADAVLDVLFGYTDEAHDLDLRAVAAMEDLAEELAEAGDGNVRTVTRALARRIVNMGVPVSTEPGQLPVEALSEAIGWFLGVDLTYPWEAEMPRADSLGQRAEAWVEKVANAKGVWDSQAAAIKALVVHGASPYEANRVAKAAFAS